MSPNTATHQTGLERNPSDSTDATSFTEREIEEMSTEDLLATYKKTGNQDLKWPLVLRYEGMVKGIALQVQGIYSGFAQVEDIVSEGILALMTSVDKYDPGKGVKFETFVSKRIRGMIIDLARRQDWLPRNVRRRAREIDQTTTELYYSLGRFPTDEEIASALGITQAKYQKDLSSLALCNLLSLDALLEEREMGGGRLGIPSEDQQGQPEAALREREFQRILADAIQSLRKNEQTVLSLYYERNLKMKEIAQVMGVSEPRISQLHARAIQKLKVMMGEYLGISSETETTERKGAG